MPELPEVETVVRTLAPKITGSIIERVDLLREKSRSELSEPFEKLINLQISSVHRRGKLILFDLQNPKKDFDPTIPELLIFHLRMTGRLLVKPCNCLPDKHTRAVFSLKSAKQQPIKLFFDDIRTFGQILALTKKSLANWNFWKTLGPEPLEIDRHEFASRLNASASIKSALLDQHVIAGIGNIYADESLFDAKIDPRRPANTLDEQEKATLLKSIQRILKIAIEKKGSSIKDYVDANGESGSFQKTFSVYGRGSQPCHVCNNKLEKIKIGGRSTVFCPLCQK